MNEFSSTKLFALPEMDIEKRMDYGCGTADEKKKNMEKTEKTHRASHLT